MRNYTHEELEAHCRELWDTQWMNVVNHDNCYYGWDKGEAINHAVNMAEDYMRENFDAYVATLRQQAEQPSDDEPRLFSYDATGNRESVRVRWPGVDDVLTYVLEAEQPGVVVSDEVVERAIRGKFEAWVQSTRGWAACRQRGKPFSLRQTVNGDYCDYRVNDRWHAWQAATRITGESA